MNTKKIITTGLLVWLATTAIGWLTCGWLFNWVYSIPPIIWKSPEVMMSAGNFTGSIIAGLIAAFIFVFVYAAIYNGVKGEGVGKGVRYGFYVWLLGTVSGLISLPFYMTVATTVVVYWIIQGLVVAIVNGAIVGKMYKPESMQ